jgi:sodium transport system ATP-binding protein
MIQADGLSKRFGSVTAVSQVSMTAADGAITGLLGPNGAGKSTTLRMLHGLVRPDTGSVQVDGLDAQRDGLAVRRRIGVLPDGLGLYPRLTAAENVAYYGALHGLKGAALARRVDELVELLEMGGIRDRRTDGFSQGERMKVALARALVHNPQNVLLDEPTNGLDVMSTRAVRGLIRQLRDEGRCIVFSSHIMQEVAALCDRIVVVAHGQVVADGTPDELRERTGFEDLEDAFVSLAGGPPPEAAS